MWVKKDLDRRARKQDHRVDILRPASLCLQRRKQGMWTVVYIAPNKPVAEMMKELLEKEGVLVMLRPAGVPHVGNSGNVEVLVPECEAEDAQELLAASFGG